MTEDILKLIKERKHAEWKYITLRNKNLKKNVMKPMRKGQMTSADIFSGIVKVESRMKQLE